MLLSCLFGVQPDDFHDLVADGVYRIQAGHGVLEDDGNFVAADLGEIFFGHFLDLVSVEPHVAADQLAGISGQAHDGLYAVTDLPEPTLPTMPSTSPSFMVNGDTVQCLYFSGRGKERETFMLYIYQIIVIHLHYCSPSINS